MKRFADWIAGIRAEVPTHAEEIGLGILACLLAALIVLVMTGRPDHATEAGIGAGAYPCVLLVITGIHGIRRVRVARHTRRQTAARTHRTNARTGRSTRRNRRTGK